MTGLFPICALQLGQRYIQQAHTTCAYAIDSHRKAQQTHCEDWGTQHKGFTIYVAVRAERHQRVDGRDKQIRSRRRASALDNYDLHIAHSRFSHMVHSMSQTLSTDAWFLHASVLSAGGPLDAGLERLRRLRTTAAQPSEQPTKLVTLHIAQARSLSANLYHA